MMIRKNIYIDKSHNDILEKHTECSISEHIRRAIDEYIKRLEVSSHRTSPTTQ